MSIDRAYLVSAITDMFHAMHRGEEGVTEGSSVWNHFAVAFSIQMLAERVPNHVEGESPAEASDRVKDRAVIVEFVRSLPKEEILGARESARQMHRNSEETFAEILAGIQ